MSTTANITEQKFDIGDALPEEYEALLLHLLEAHNENFGSDWYPNHLTYLFDQAMKLAPDPETRFRMAQFVADESSHGWMFYTVTQEMGVDVRHWGIKVSVFDDILDTWPDYDYFNALGDLAGTYQATQFAESSFLPLARIGSTVVRDEWAHSKMGQLHLRNLCATPEGKAVAGEYLKKWWPLTLDMFGRSNSTRNERYRFWGLKRNTNAELRATFQEYAERMLRGIGLDVPDPLEGRRFM